MLVIDHGKKAYILLSHFIRGPMPSGSRISSTTLEIQPLERLDKGDHANSSLVTLHNHCGTHIDAPGHMCLGRNFLIDIPITQFIFERPYLIDIPTGDCGLIMKSQLEAKASFLADCDLLLIRTGYSRCRSIDMDRYIWKTPGVSLEAAEYLVHNFSGIRAVGIDFLSFECLDDLSHGFKAHKILFQNDIIIIEDMNMMNIGKRQICRVFAFPLFIENVDSFHVTVVAEVLENEE